MVPAPQQQQPVTPPGMGSVAPQAAAAAAATPMLVPVAPAPTPATSGHSCNTCKATNIAFPFQRCLTCADVDICLSCSRGYFGRMIDDHDGIEGHPMAVIKSKADISALEATKAKAAKFDKVSGALRLLLD